jgi:hypothetical protein
MLAKKRVANRSSAASRSKRAAFNAVETFTPMSVDELWKVHQTLEKILSKKITVETADLKRRFANLKN